MCYVFVTTEGKKRFCFPMFFVSNHWCLNSDGEILWVEEIKHCHRANQLNAPINCIDGRITRTQLKNSSSVPCRSYGFDSHQLVLRVITCWNPCMGSDSCGRMDGLMISSPCRSIGQVSQKDVGRRRRGELRESMGVSDGQRCGGIMREKKMD